MYERGASGSSGPAPALPGRGTCTSSSPYPPGSAGRRGARIRRHSDGFTPPPASGTPDATSPRSRRRSRVRRGWAEPPDARALFHLGAELFWVGDFAAARACFERWLELYGGTTDDALTVINRLAACLRLDGDLDAALRLELDAFEARPDWLPTAAGLVQSYAAMHRWADVVEWAERAIALDPPQTAVPIVLLEVTVVPRLRLAEAELALGHTGPARRAFRSAAMLVPGAVSLERHRARFEQLLDGSDTSGGLREVRAAIAPYDETMRAALRGLTLGAPR